MIRFTSRVRRQPSVIPRKNRPRTAKIGEIEIDSLQYPNGWQCIRREEAQLERLSIPWLGGAGQPAAFEHDRDVVGHVAVGILDMDTALDRQDPFRSHHDAGFLVQLPSDGLGRVLSRLADPRWEAPFVRVAAQQTEDMAGVILDHGSYTGEQHRRMADLLAKLPQKGRYGHGASLPTDPDCRQETEANGSAASPMEWLGLDDRSHSEQPFLTRSD